VESTLDDRFKPLQLIHRSIWSKELQIQEVSNLKSDENREENPLISLNLAHNNFGEIPKCLACLAPNLQRLNLSYNSLASFGSEDLHGALSHFPAELKHLDLSYNQIAEWPGDTLNR